MELLKSINNQEFLVEFNQAFAAAHKHNDEFKVREFDFKFIGKFTGPVVEENDLHFFIVQSGDRYLMVDTSSEHDDFDYFVLGLQEAMPKGQRWTLKMHEQILEGNPSEIPAF